MTSAPIRLGLVGGGAIAQIAELPALAARSSVTIAGIVTRRAETAAANLARWPIERAYDSLDAMIDGANLDAVLVVTPKQDHTRFVETAIEAGLDVFCEKPLATSLADAQRVADLAQQRGRILMVGFNRRYAEVYVRARAVFADAPPRFVVAQKNRRGSEYRATLENSIHMVDLLRWFCGEAVEVTAHSIATDPYAEEGTAALIRFDGGSIAVLMAARCAGEWDERLEAYGDLTSVRVVAPDTVSIARDGETRLLEGRPRANGWANITETGGFGPEIDHFIECIRERREPLTSGQDAVRTQELVERIVRVAGLPTTDAEWAVAR